MGQLRNPPEVVKGVSYSQDARLRAQVHAICLTVNTFCGVCLVWKLPSASLGAIGLWFSVCNSNLFWLDVCLSINIRRLTLNEKGSFNAETPCEA